MLIFPMFVEPGVMGPLYSAPIADVVTLLVAGVMMAGVLKKLNQSAESALTYAHDPDILLLQ